VVARFARPEGQILLRPADEAGAQCERRCRAAFAPCRADRLSPQVPRIFLRGAFVPADMARALALYTGRDAAPGQAGTRPTAAARMHHDEVSRPGDMLSARCGRTDPHGELHQTDTSAARVRTRRRGVFHQADKGAAGPARSVPRGCAPRRDGKWVMAWARKRR
jgi:hypothetical protein